MTIVLSSASYPWYYIVLFCLLPPWGQNKWIGPGTFTSQGSDGILQTVDSSILLMVYANMSHHSLFLHLWKISYCRKQNYRWQNGKQYDRKTNSAQSELAQRAPQGCTSLPPSRTPVLDRVAVFVISWNFCKNFNSVFCEILTKYFWILRNLRKIWRNTKLKILTFFC